MKADIVTLSPARCHPVNHHNRLCVEISTTSATDGRAVLVKMAGLLADYLPGITPGRLPAAAARQGPVLIWMPRWTDIEALQLMILHDAV